MDYRFLKTSLFGYSKSRVCEYIAYMNAQFSERLMAVTEENKQERNALLEKIASLEKELSEYKRTHGEIASAILDAKEYGAELKRKAEKETAQMRMEIAREKNVLDSQLDNCLKDMNELCELLQK